MQDTFLLETPGGGGFGAPGSAPLREEKVSKTFVERGSIYEYRKAQESVWVWCRQLLMDRIRQRDLGQEFRISVVRRANDGFRTITNAIANVLVEPNQFCIN